MPPTSVRCPACGHALLTVDLPLASMTAQPTRPDAPLLLRIPEAAALLRVSRSTLYQMVGNGDVPVIRIGRSVRIARAALERLAGG